MRISGPRGRGPAVVAGTVAVVLVVAAAVALAVLRDPTPADRTTTAPPVVAVGPGARSVPVARAVGALAVLRDWDRARSAAWAAGEVAALRRLYVRGSAVGRRDVAMLEAWRARGLRVVDLRTQVLAVELRRRAAARIVLLVTDRIVGAVAERDGRRRALPRDRATTRRLEFQRVAGEWLLASAQERPSPAASTASTSGSENS